jgi:hypothetical protein
MDLKESKSKKFSGRWIVLAALVGLAAGYLAAGLIERFRGEPAVTQSRTLDPSPQLLQKPGLSPVQETASSLVKEKVPPQNNDPEAGIKPQQSCAQIQAEISAFFDYISSKAFFRHLEPDLKAQDRFRVIVERLSAKPPIPGGEGIDTSIIINNIYCLFRSLDRKDLRLIKEFIANEGDALELDLALFYRWFMLDDQCKDEKKLKPSFDVVYHYAGFFLNTIGGRAYLLRRPATVRTLAAYYCILILHEANLRGRNTYGIDIVPHIISLKDEIINTKDLALEPDYLKELASVERYYLKRR